MYNIISYICDSCQLIIAIFSDIINSENKKYFISKQKSKNYQNILTIFANSCKIIMIKGFRNFILSQQTVYQTAC